MQVVLVVVMVHGSTCDCTWKVLKQMVTTAATTQLEGCTKTGPAKLLKRCCFAISRHVLELQL